MARPATKPARQPKAPKQPPIPPALEERPILYAKSGGPPVNWRKLRIMRVSTGKEVRDVVEANAFEGWVVQALRDDEGNLKRRGAELSTRRVEMKIRIEVRP